MSARLFLCCSIVICTTITSFVRGIPKIDLSSGNTVVQERGLSVRGTTTQCYGSLPSFTWDLVSTDKRISPIQLLGDQVIATIGGHCDVNSSRYTGSVSVNYNVNPVVYGKTVQLRLTIDNNPNISSLSSGTLSFPVIYNLTGSSEKALIGKQFTWTCQMDVPPDETYDLVAFYRNENSIGFVGNVTGYQGSSIDPRYNYSCTSQTEFNLIIPSQNMTEEENNTIWRCSYFSGNPLYSSVQKQLVTERKPDAPNNISLDCEISMGRALIEWIPGFDGGAKQTFVVSYRTNDGLQNTTIQIYLRSDVTVTGLDDGTLYFLKVIASNKNGEASSEEVHCMTIESTVLESDIGGIIGGTIGSISFVIIIVLYIFIKREYQIKCFESVPNLRKKKTEVSNRTLELKGVHYEELKDIGWDQERSYDVTHSSHDDKIQIIQIPG